MTFSEFDEYQDELLEKVREVKNTKGREYAGTEDRFSNFNRLAADLDLDRLKICQVYLTKHLDAIKSYVRQKRIFSTESVEDRIVDAITYLTLLAGMIKESQSHEK